MYYRQYMVTIALHNNYNNNRNNTEPFNTHRAELIEYALIIDPVKGCTEINVHYPSYTAHTPMQFAVYGSCQKVHHSQTWWLGAHPCVP